jgi:hypothetical protein
VVSPPLVGAETWLPVMEAAGYRCSCTGACGNKHTVSEGHCDRVHNVWISKYGQIHLIAAPADLTEAVFPGAALKSQPLVAWCPPCYDGARRKAKRAVAAAEPEGLLDLFDTAPYRTAPIPETGRA